MSEYDNAEQFASTNPFAAGAQNAANTSGSMATGIGSQLAALSSMLSGEASALNPSMSSILNMGFDPQNALYAQTLQRINDQANVANAQYGLTGQQAAGNVQQADTNFNLNWNNEQLGRALQSIQGAQSVGQTQAGLSQASGQAGTGAVDFTGQGGTLPYAAYGSNINNVLQALSGAAGFNTQSNQVPLQIMQSIIPYLNYGSGATNAAVGAAGANSTANQFAGQGLGSLFSGLSGLFSGSSPFSGGSNPLNLSPGSNFTGGDLSSISNAFDSFGGGFTNFAAGY